MNDEMRLLRAPTAEQIVAEHGEPIVQDVPQPDPNKEVVALATAVFQSISPRVYDSHRLLAAQMAATLGANFWMIPCQQRMPFPDAPLFALAAMFRLEKKTGRCADWFLWVEDDVSVPQDLFEVLRKSADPDDRPFVCAPGFIRSHPFRPAVWETMDGVYTRWETVPESGVYKVTASGLVAALFHRSLFNRIPQPWFAVTSNKMYVNDNGQAEVDRGLKPDAWWAEQLEKAGIPVYVNCDVNVTHFGMPIPINKYTAASLRALPFFDNLQVFERSLRGLPAGDISTMYAGLRQGLSQGVGSAHAPCDTPGEHLPAQPFIGSVQPQVAPAARPELPDEFSVDESPGLWRDWKPAWS